MSIYILADFLKSEGGEERNSEDSLQQIEQILGKFPLVSETDQQWRASMVSGMICGLRTGYQEGYENYHVNILP